MKKLTTALLTALLLLNLAACGEKEPDDTPSGYDDSLISELYSEEGEYTDAENNTLAYSYHVPRIMSETAVAAALNDEIADQFGALVQEQKNMMASRVSSRAFPSRGQATGTTACSASWCARRWTATQA